MNASSRQGLASTPIDQGPPRATRPGVPTSTRARPLSPHWRGPEDDKDGQEAWFTGENRIPYRIDRRLPGLAEPDYDATISFGLPFELGDCPYGESRLKFSAKVVSERSRRKTGKQWHDDYDTRNAAILSLDGMGFRQREIGAVMGIGQQRVSRILQELTRNGTPEFWEPYT